MKTFWNKLDKDWQDLVIVILGLWLFLSPFILQYISTSPGAAGTSFLIGALMIGIAMTGLSIHQFWEEWTNLVLAACLIASPWVLGFATMPLVMGNVIAVGAVTAICTMWVLIQGYIRHHSKGYSSRGERMA